MKSVLLSLILAVFLTGQAAAITPQEVESAVNQVRSSNHLVRLRDNAVLDRSANLKAQDLCNENYWSHTTPDGRSPWWFFRKAGYNLYRGAGENLAEGFNDTDPLINAWVNSPTHYRVMRGHYTIQGVAVVNCPDYLGQGPTTIVVNHFGNQVKHKTIRRVSK